MESDRLTIALVAFEYPPEVVTGVGVYTHALATGLAARGHRVHVLTRGQISGTIGHDGGITIHYLAPTRTSRRDDHLPKSLLEYFLEELKYRWKIADTLVGLIPDGVDVIEVPDGNADALMFNPRRHPRIPFIVRMHTPVAVLELFDKTLAEPIRMILKFLERRMLLKATHLSVPSRASAEFFRKEMELGDRRMTILPNPPPVSIEVWSASTRTDPNQVLYLGRLQPQKGVEVLFQAIPHVLQQHPEARFIIVGDDNSIAGKQRVRKEQYLAMIPDQYHHAIRFTGHVPNAEVAGFYQRAALCVFPSLFDNFPYACLEAMTFGKAIIGSRNGGMLELLDDGRAGLLYTPPDAKELEVHIIRLLKDPQLRSDLGEKARRRVLTVYNRDLVIEETLSYYRSTVHELVGESIQERLEG